MSTKRRTRRKPPRTLSEWYERQTLPWRCLSESSGVPMRTIYRVARGEPCTVRTATALHGVTKIPILALLRGTI